MKLEKKHWIIIVVVAVILVWYFFLRKKTTESGFDQFGSPNDPFGEDTPKCPAGEVYNESLPGCVPDEKKESGYRGIKTSNIGSSGKDESRRIPGTNIAYDYSYPLPQNTVNCGPGCKPFLGICWCIKLGKASGVSGLGGECPHGTQCCSRYQGQCIECCPAGSGVKM